MRLRYLKSLLLHKWYVILAGLRIGGIPILRLIFHDISKFSRREFLAYAQKYGTDSKPQSDQEEIELKFAYAWLHHESRNPHHWSYWIPRSGHYANQPLPMPKSYVREMVADWHAANRAYRGSWDSANWLKNNLLQMKLHPTTRQYVNTILQEMGYEL